MAMNESARESTVMSSGMYFQFEDAIGRAEADWYCSEDTRPLRRAIAEDVWPRLSEWLAAGASEEFWAENRSLQERLDDLGEEAGWWRAQHPDEAYPGG